MAKHSKHTKLQRRSNGIYAPNEVAIVGAKCSIIEQLVVAIAEQISQFKLGYFDASHAKDVEESAVDIFTFHHKGPLEIQGKEPVNKFNQRIQFSQYDLLFINGNHYPGVKHIVLLDPEKEASIEKRMDQIESVIAFVKVTSNAVVFDCLKEKFENVSDIPIFEISEIDAISNLVQQTVKHQIPELNGLVLVGGKSTRMGTDKSVLDYHGTQQKDFIKQLLEDQKITTYFSKRKEQDFEEENAINDTFLNLGPFGAICSAFQKNPNSAYLVVATDLPFVTKEVLNLLIENRDSSKIATAVIGKGNDFPEPLVTIWEPKSYPLLLSYLSQGYSCPRKVLINSDVKLVEVETRVIRNINTPEEFQQAKKDING